MNLPLGIDLELAPQVYRLKLQAGDLICLYTDGLTEQEDEAGREFGETSVVRLACRAGAATDTLPDALVDALARHQGSVPRLDDVTWLQLKVL
jgi:sigma-B regulation protein RsbU (phosphoserine phosphatase)